MPVLQRFRRGSRDSGAAANGAATVEDHAPGSNGAGASAAVEELAPDQVASDRVAAVLEYLVALDERRSAPTNAVDLFGADRAALRALARHALDGLQSGAPDAGPPLIELFDEVAVELGVPAPVAPPALPWLTLRTADGDLRLVGAVEERTTVLVEAPRGATTTGAIANLVTHLLATGRSVLVTGPTPHALHAVGTALPAGFAGLCATVAAADPEGASAHERWIAVHRARSADPFWTDAARVDGRIAALREQLVAGRREMARLEAAHERVRAIEAARHDLGFGGYRGTISSITERLLAEETELGWLTDRPAVPCPLSGAEAAELVALLRSTAPLTLFRAAQRVPGPADLPTPARLVELIAAERDAGPARVVSDGLGGSRFFAPLAAATPEARDAVVTTAETLRARRDRVLRGREPWLAAAVADVLDGRDEEWRERRRVTRSVLDRVPRELRDLDATAVDGVETMDPDALGAQIQVLLEHLRAGGSMRRWRVLKPGPVKAARELLAQVRVDGQPPSTIERLERLAASIDVDDRLSRAERRWGGRLGPALEDGHETVFAARRTRLTDAGSVLERVLALGSARDQARAACTAVAGLPAPRWSADQDLAELLHCARVAEESARCAACLAEIELAAGTLGDVAADPAAAPECADAASALERRDVPAYANAYEAIVRVGHAARAVARWRRAARSPPRARAVDRGRDRPGSLRGRVARARRAAGGGVGLCSRPGLARRSADAHRPGRARTPGRAARRAGRHVGEPARLA